MNIQNIVRKLLVRFHKCFTSCCFRTDHDPNEFLFLLLPLAALVAILVVVVFYLAIKEDNVRHKEVETLNELMRTGAVDKENFSAALQGLVRDKIIDKNSSERLRKLLEDSFNEPEETCSQPEPA